MGEDIKIPVLIVSYLFPPRGGVGVQRVTKIVKYLPRYGFQPIVLTVKKPKGSVAEDPALLNEIPRDVAVVRTKSIEPYHIYKALGGKKKQDDPSFRKEQVAGVKRSFISNLYYHYQRRYLIPDTKIGWLKPAVRAGIKIVKKYAPRMILSTSPESTAHLVALKLHRKFKIPFIADFRDPWVSGFYSLDRPALAAAKERRMEFNVLNEADAVTVVMQSYVDGFLSNHTNIHEQKFHIIPNGFDESDYENISAREFDKFTIVHTGSIYHQRSPVPFFKAVSEFLKRNPDAKDEINIILMGRVDKSYLSDAQTLGINNVIEIESFASHEKSLMSQLGADVLLLLSEGVMTAKVYEYLRAGKPIIGFAPDGEMTKQISDWGVGRIFTHEQTNEAASFLSEMYKGWKNHSEPIWSDFKRVDLTPYERTNQVRKLSEIMRSILTN